MFPNLAARVDTPAGALSGGELIARIAKAGVAILLVEQNLSIAMNISNRGYIMGHGRVVFEGTPEQLKNNAAIREEWLEV